MVSLVLVTSAVVAIAIQRLFELRTSARHEAALLARGAREHAAGQMPWMRALHALWLIGTLAEAWLLGRVAPPWLIALGLVGLAIGQALRLAAMRALGPRWSVKVLTVPGETAIATGIFRHLRHPNYLGVILELAALPLIGGAWITALVASAANAILLRARIAAEERALREDSDYASVHGQRPRFVPLAGS